ncbi:MAG: hypothetical protein JSS09_08100 [Verrucomicrobia bacterium]|nr:hypothetical protein [Verrucomicrobiota bacterium]
MPYRLNNFGFRDPGEVGIQKELNLANLTVVSNSRRAAHFGRLYTSYLFNVQMQEKIKIT